MYLPIKKSLYLYICVPIKTRTGIGIPLKTIKQFLSNTKLRVRVGLPKKPKGRTTKKTKGWDYHLDTATRFAPVTQLFMFNGYG